MNTLALTLPRARLEHVDQRADGLDLIGAELEAGAPVRPQPRTHLGPELERGAPARLKALERRVVLVDLLLEERLPIALVLVRDRGRGRGGARG